MRQHLRELETVNRIGQALASQLDLEALIELVGDLIGETFSADVSYVALYDAETGEIEFPVLQRGRRPKPRTSRCRSATGRRRRVLKTRETLLLHGSAEFAELGERRVGAAGGSYLGVPILAGEQAIGALERADDR